MKSYQQAREMLIVKVSLHERKRALDGDSQNDENLDHLEASELFEFYPGAHERANDFLTRVEMGVKRKATSGDEEYISVVSEELDKMDI